MIRRSPIVLGATIAGTAGVLAFHPQSATVQTASATTTPTTVTTAAKSSTTSTGSSSGDGTATGRAVSTRYGDAQVRVTVKNGKIVKITAVQLQSGDPRSQEISSSAEPTLQQEALSKQTADVDAVSGASYTSASYTQSLQSALDKLGFKAADGSRATLQVPSGGG
jgi:uncharacterized protein with FMN-binding domain